MSITRIRAVCLAAALVPLLATCGGGHGEPSEPVAAALVFATTPSTSATDHAPLPVIPVVQLVDEGGLPVAIAGVPVTVSSSTPGQFILTGTGGLTRETDADGRATFDGIGTRGIPGGYSLRFSAPGLPTITAPVAMAAGAPALLTLTGAPISGIVGTVVPALQLELHDTTGNKILNVTFTLTVTAGHGTVSPAVTTLSGTALVTDFKLDTLKGNNTLQVVVASAPNVAATFATVTGVPGAPVRMVFDSSWTGPLVAHSSGGNGMSATVADSYGNPLVGQLVSFWADGPGDAFVIAGVPTDGNGVATLSSWSTPDRAGEYTVGASTGPGPGPLTRLRKLTVIPSAPAAVWVESDLHRGAVGVGVPARAAVLDRFGNRIPGMPVTLTPTQGVSHVDRDSSLSGGDGWLPFQWVFDAPGDQEISATSSATPGEARTFALALALKALISLSDTVLQGTPGKGFLVSYKVVDSTGIGIEGVPVRYIGQPDASKDTGPDGVVSFDGVFDQALGTFARRVTSPWIPGDTIRLTLNVTPGPISGFDSMGPSPRFVVGVRNDSTPRLRVRDVGGWRIPSVVVHFDVDHGVLTADSAVADTAGFVQMPGWVPDTIAGFATVTVTSGAATRTLTLLAHHGPITTLSVLAGGPPLGFAGEQVLTSARLSAADRYGNAVDSGRVASVQVIAGGGVATGTASVRGDRLLHVDGWTLGDVGVNTIRVTIDSATIDVNAEAEAANPFQILLRGVPARYQDVFGTAVFRWRRRITADIPDVTVGIAGGQCASFQGPLSGTVDDLVIDVSIGSIDGPGAILGGATPCFIRTADSLPILGVMQFDEADLALLESQGTLGDVILHEMGHVLGIGSLWSFDGLLVNFGTVNVQYTGAGGKQGWADLGGGALGTPNVPVENTGGPGTADSHWRESVMPSELMTGYLSALVNPMSEITVRSLSDLGYSVDPSTADPYVLGQAPPVASGRAGLRIQDRVGRPGFTVDPDGRIRPLP